MKGLKHIYKVPVQELTKDSEGDLTITPYHWWHVYIDRDEADEEEVKALLENLISLCSRVNELDDWKINKIKDSSIKKENDMIIIYAMCETPSESYAVGAYLSGLLC